MKNVVYMAGVVSILPHTYETNHVIEVLYSQALAPRKVNRLAHRLAGSVGIRKRSTVLDLSVYPKKKLLLDQYSPKNWGLQVVDNLTELVDVSDIGHLSVSYNITSHAAVLPNLACQIAMARGLDLDSMPEEISCYGCASSILSLRSAFEYCQKSDRAAVAYTFDQCLWISDPIYDPSDSNFRADLRSHLLFSDGAVGVLLITESMAGARQRRLMRVLDADVSFHLGDAVHMESSRFLVGDDVANIMPGLAAETSIGPVLKRNALDPHDIKEWSIHQGGLPVLQAFKDKKVLGLTDQQLSRSKELFLEYDNLSSPSCLLVLNDFFHEKNPNRNDYGIVAAFGAGYYLATLLYRWE